MSSAALTEYAAIVKILMATLIVALIRQTAKALWQFAYRCT